MRGLLIAVGIALVAAPPGCAPPKADSTRRGDPDQKPGTSSGASEAPQRAVLDVPKLAADLASTDTHARWHAAGALADVGPGAAVAVPALVKALTDADPRVRGHAARALGMIDDKSDGTISGLARLVADPDARVRRAAIMALSRLRPGAANTIPLMVEALEDADPAVVMGALQTLAEGGADSVPALTEALQHKQGRYWACLVLAEMGSQAKAAVPQLAALVKDAEPEVRMEAVMALGEIGPDAAPAAAALTEALADTTPAVRYAAAFSLGKIGSQGALPALEKAEQDEDPFLSMVAAWAVAKLKPEDKEAVAKAVDLIVAALQQDDANVRRGAAKALWELNAPQDVVGPALMAALEDTDPIVQSNVFAGLASLGQDAVPRLVEKLDNPRTRDQALRVLGLMGPQAKSAVPHLLEALPAADAQQRRELLFTLANIGAESAPATPAIVKLLADADEDVRVAAGYALGKIGPPAVEATDALRKNLGSEDRTLRLVSIWALLRIKPNDVEIVRIAVPELTSVVAQGETELARTEAAAALGDIGPSAKSALPALKKALSDDSPAVRAAAAEALSKIGE